MNERQLDGLLAAIGSEPAGVDYDGLVVAHDSEGYVFETPEERHTGLDESEFRTLATENPWFVSNWGFWRDIESPTATAYLRWVERAERGVRERYEALATGTSREWGQLRVTATLLEDGERSYELRHVEDSGVAFEELTNYVDPHAAREISTLDPDGRYRPLKTAPTLKTGWVFADLSGTDLLEAIDSFYPATVANWYRERTGDLDVTHYRETATRQTGIYEVIDELPSEALNWVAEACCVDSQCLKRRQWDEDGETELDVPRGEGEFPCREPCSLVIAAARQWAILENEDTRTYEFELTPSERGQLETLIEAVAEGRTEDIREADVADGANRYRARYLRAKRLEDGRLQ